MLIMKSFAAGCLLAAGMTWAEFPLALVIGYSVGTTGVGIWVGVIWSVLKTDRPLTPEN